MRAGSGGSKPCFCCYNVCSCKCGWEKEDNRLVSTRCNDDAKFVPYTDALIWRNWDALAKVKGRINNEDFEKMQQVFGLTYSDAPLAMLGKQLRGYISPSQIMVDPAHIFLCNGILSWEIWDFLEELRKVSGAKLGWDSFATFLADIDWRIPMPDKSAATPSVLRRLLDAERIKASRANGSDHYKGGADEHLMVYKIFIHFAEEVASKIPGMEQAVKALLSACACVEGFFAPQADREWVALRAPPEVMRKHVLACFEDYMAAHAVTDVKPKWHAAGHIRPANTNSRFHRPALQMHVL